MNLKIAANNLLLLSTSLSSVLATTSGSLRGLERSDSNSNFECTLLIKVTKFYDDSEHHDLECETEEGTIYPFENMPDSVKDKFESGSIESNFDKLRVVGRRNVEFRNAKLAIQPGSSMSIVKRNKKDIDDRKRRLQSTSVRDTLALWVKAADAQTTGNPDGGSGTLTDEVFGTYDDTNNLRSKYLQCSYDKLDFKPFTGITSTGAQVTNGVYSVTISNNVSGADDGVIRDAAINAATTALGNLSQQFDHVMVCIPPGTNGGWIGYAYINGWRSVYNDVWCNYLSIQMHEIGHNLGLAHSGETATYDDQSGMMGFSYSQDDGPNMCFNAVKSWQLGWYNDKSLELNSGNFNWSGKVYGINDYGSTIDGNIIVRLVASTTADDFYVSFNKKNGINSGTVEGGNQVLVHRRPSGTGYAASVLLAKLNAGGSYTVTIDGISVPIIVNSLTTGDSGFAEVVIGSFSPTPAPTPCVGKSVTVNVNTDNYPTETSWVLTNTCTNTDELSVSAGTYTTAAQLYTTTECVPDAAYTFTISDSYGDGICCSYGSGSYEVLYDNAPVASGGAFASSESTSFGSCGTTPTAPPTSPPSKAPTAPPTSAPTNVVTKSPTASPTSPPTKTPTAPPTTPPTKAPTLAPTKTPTSPPTLEPTAAPTTAPTQSPTNVPTSAPTKAPVTDAPTIAPTPAAPTASPTNAPTAVPSQAPTDAPTVPPTNPPTPNPTNDPGCSSFRKSKDCRDAPGCVWRKGSCEVAST